MGQRSQIYVRIQDDSGRNGTQTDMLPLYYSWNYSDRMVSRVAHTCEWLEESAKYYFQGYRDRLQNIMKTNFDLKDCIDANDIFLEAATYPDNGVMPQGEELNNAVFYDQANNDGKAFINVAVDQNKKAHISVCFTDRDLKKIMTASEYMNWEEDYEDAEKNWIQAFTESEYRDDEDIATSLKNIKLLEQYEQMSKKQLNELFLEADLDKIAVQHQIDNLAKTPYLGNSLRKVGNYMLDHEIKFNNELIFDLAVKLQSELDAICYKQEEAILKAGDDHNAISMLRQNYTSEWNKITNRFLEEKVLPIQKQQEEMQIKETEEIEME